MSDSPALGLIAGAGGLPAAFASALRARGTPVHAIALHALCDAALADAASSCTWLHLGEWGRMLEALRAAGAERVLLAGKVPKAFLWQRPDAVRPDARALRFLASLRDRKDDSLLGAVAEILGAEGIAVLSQLEAAPGLVGAAGPLTARPPTDVEWADIDFAWPVARALGGLDVGQSVVVQGRAVLALEAIEGTDAAIARGLAFAERGKPACVVKLAKPSQDARFDVPTIGPGTVRALAAGGGSALAYEAGRTLVLGRAELAALADAHGIAVVGVDPRARGQA
jgi:hypothetical protein